MIFAIQLLKLLNAHSNNQGARKETKGREACVIAIGNSYQTLSKDQEEAHTVWIQEQFINNQQKLSLDKVQYLFLLSTSHCKIQLGPQFPKRPQIKYLIELKTRRERNS